MNQAAISIRIAPLKQHQIRGQLQHDQRTGRVPAYVDRSRSAENTAPRPSPGVAAMVRHARSLCTKKPRQDWTPVWSGIVTFSHAAQEKILTLTNDEQDAIYLKVARDAAAELGVALHCVSVHRDETAPHAHFMLSGVKQGGKSLRPKPGDLSKLQDVAARAVQHLGISRGTAKQQRIAQGQGPRQTTHRTVKQLHEDLPREIAELEKTRDELLELFSKAPKPRFEKVEVIKRRRTLLPPVTEFQKVITKEAQANYVQHIKSIFAEYFQSQKTKVDQLENEMMNDRLRVSESLRKIRGIEENLQRIATTLKDEIELRAKIQAQIEDAVGIHEDVRYITQPLMRPQ
ncbi:MAG: plasmid recombination protein [Candidatus Igneacidithiobacillus chanchocoensis]